MRKALSIVFLVLMAIQAVGQERTMPEQYINMYKHLAVQEMKRTGIPASITLAQGLLESGNGNSRLAKEANNHFGIKCKSNWQGRSVKADDDAPQECFRAYDRVEESYRDHSDFLTGGQRYAFLFELDPLDYEAWAKGLKQAGYATNPKYADLIISIVERYQLFQYDIGNKRVVKQPETATPHKEPEVSPSGTVVNKAFTYNDLPAYIVQAGDTYDKITKEKRLMRWQIRKYNELNKDEKLEPGTILYLKPKRRKANEDYHIVNEGESMYYISQLHAIKLRLLYKWNLMEEGQEAAPGEKLWLRKKRDNPPKLLNAPKFASRQPLMQKTKDVAKVEKPAPVKKPEQEPLAAKDTLMMIPAGEADFSNIAQKQDTLTQTIATHEKPVLTPEYHIVQQGETIYGIAGKYALPAEDIMIWNRLSNPTLSVGQKLKLKDTEEEKEVQLAISATGELITTSTSGTETVVETDSLLVVQEVGPSAPEGNIITKNNNTEPAPLAEAMVPGSETYTVTQGETLYSISKKTGAPIDSLVAWNALKDYSLSVGQVLKLASTTTKKQAPASAEYHKVSQGDTLYSIARKYQLTVDQLKSLNSITDNSISIGQQLKVRN